METIKDKLNYHNGYTDCVKDFKEILDEVIDTDKRYYDIVSITDTTAGRLPPEVKKIIENHNQMCDALNRLHAKTYPVFKMVR